jgi:hypothetical protein
VIDIQALFRRKVHAVGKREGDQFTNVRTVDGNLAICTTIYSGLLDHDGACSKYYDNREAAAERIALMWNACRGISNAALLALSDKVDAADAGFEAMISPNGASPAERSALPRDDLSNLRDETARIVDPWTHSLLMKGQLNSRGHEIWEQALAKADQIQALYVGLGRGSSPAESVSEGLRPFASESSCQSEDITQYGRCRGCFVHEGELHLPDCPVMEANLAALNPDRVMNTEGGE